MPVSGYSCIVLASLICSVGRSARRGLVRAALVIAVALGALPGCGDAAGGPWTPGGVGPIAGADEDTWATAGGDSVAAARSMAGDLVAGVEEAVAAAAGEGDEGAATAVTAGSGETKVIYLHYADGNPLPRTAVDPCRRTAPKFECEFAPTLEECQRQVQAYLDRWYAPFNVVFTLKRPTSGKFYTEVVSSGGGAWCDADAKVAGLSPFLCKDLEGGVAYTFLGGKTALETAIIIAQEQAHLVGLQHTESQRDVMNPTICTNCEGGFEDQVNRVTDDRCGRPTQSSYQLMKERLGTWGGGIKPTPFGCKADQTAPAVAITEPASGASVSRTFRVRVQASDDCEVSRVRVAVAPMRLAAESMTPPFEWTVANISGRQTITVTATDLSGKTTSTSVTVDAPIAPEVSGGGSAAPGVGDAEGFEPGGCQVAGCGLVSSRGSTTSMLAGAFLVAALVSRPAARGRARRR